MTKRNLANRLSEVIASETKNTVYDFTVETSMTVEQYFNKHLKKMA